MKNSIKLPDKLQKQYSYWRAVPHDTLAAICQAYYSLLTLEETQPWMRNSAEAVASDLIGQTPPN